MIRILHFVSTPARWSGVMSVIMNYYRHMDRSRIQFDFLCFLPCDESFEAEIHSLGGKIFFVSKPSKWRGIHELANFMRIHAREYTWFHNHEVYLSFFLKPLASYYGLDNFIVHSHATRYSDRPLAALRNRITCLPISYMRCTRFACSESAGNFLFRQRQEGGHKFTVIPNAVERARFLYNIEKREECRKTLHVDDSFVLIHVGRFAPQKNHLFLLKLLHEMGASIPRVRLLLVGDGPLKEMIEKKVRDMKLSDRVLFLGQRGDIPELLQAADLFLLPSIYEGLPIACMEAQAAGLPCLVSDAITAEVCLSPKVKRLSLKAPETWLTECRKCYSEFSAGVDTAKRRCPEGIPDIAIEAGKLADFYETRNS